MSRHVLLELRSAIAMDFKDKNKCTKYGAVYFIQNTNGTIDKNINYLMPETNKVDFKNLFEAGRIFTFANPDEVIKVLEVSVLEWNEIIVPVEENLETTFEMVSQETEIDFEPKK